MSLVRSLVRDVQEFRHADPTFGQGNSLIPKNSEYPGGWAGTHAGVVINERRALQQIAVWSCVSLISDTLAQLPIAAFVGDGPTRKRVSKDPAIISEPTPGVPWTEWLGGELASDLLRGNAYGWITERDGRGFASQIHALHPDEVAPRLDRYTGGINYKVSGQTKLIDPFDILHVKGFTLPGIYNSLEGLSPVGYAAQTIGTALAAEEFGARFFGDGAHPSSVLESEQAIDENTAKEMAARWKKSHGQRHREPAVLGGGLKWKPISLSPNESQFLETIDAKKVDICGFYRVPPHMVGIVDRSTSWGTGIEEQMLGFITFTLGIWIARWEAALSALLPRPQYVKFNLAGLLRGRLTERYRAYLMGRTGGWLSIDEIRAYEDMPPLEDDKGKDYLTPLNMGAIPPGGLAIDALKDPMALLVPPPSENPNKPNASDPGEAPKQNDAGGASGLGA